MFVIQRIDPRLDIQESDWRVSSPDEARAVASDHYAYWHDMVTTDPADPREMPMGTRVTLNTDSVVDPDVYFLTIHYPESYRGDPAYMGGHTTDLFFVIRDDTDPEGGISHIRGAQCGDCGRINCAPVEAPCLPGDVVPVWRTHPDTANLLCDTCADKRYALALA